MILISGNSAVFVRERATNTHIPNNMKFVLVLAALLALAYAAPQKGKDAFITRYDSDVDGVNGKYNYAYETSDNMAMQEVGELKNAGSENEIMVVRGSYSFVGADGKTYKVDYIADENGFQPIGEHLPQ